MCDLAPLHAAELSSDVFIHPKPLLRAIPLAHASTLAVARNAVKRKVSSGMILPDAVVFTNPVGTRPWQVPRKWRYRTLARGGVAGRMTPDHSREVVPPPQLGG